MTPTFAFNEMLSATLIGARQIVQPTLGFAALFMAAIGFLFWSALALPESMLGSIAFAALTAATLFAHSLASASMYRSLLPSQGGLIKAAWKLTLAWLLIMVVAAIGATMIVLFFSLIGSSLGVVSGETGQDIADMTAQMRDGGTFYPLFILFLMTLFGVFWFAVRMMLFAGGTATFGRVHVFRAWPWTKGHFLGLATGMVLFIILPVIVLSYVSLLVTDPVPETLDPAVRSGLTAVLTAIVLLPAAWLGHSFVAQALKALAPKDGANR